MVDKHTHLINIIASLYDYYKSLSENSTDDTNWLLMKAYKALLDVEEYKEGKNDG